MYLITVYTKHHKRALIHSLGDNSGVVRGKEGVKEGEGKERGKRNLSNGKCVTIKPSTLELPDGLTNRLIQTYVFNREVHINRLSLVFK